MRFDLGNLAGREPSDAAEGSTSNVLHVTLLYHVHTQRGMGDHRLCGKSLLKVNCSFNLVYLFICCVGRKLATYMKVPRLLKKSVE